MGRGHVISVTGSSRSRQNGEGLNTAVQRVFKGLNYQNSRTLADRKAFAILPKGPRGTTVHGPQGIESRVSQFAKPIRSSY
jgi:hypothetical protein